MADLVGRLLMAAVIAVLVYVFDEPLLSVDLAWWWCALVGLVVVFGGVLIISATE